MSATEETAYCKNNHPMVVDDRKNSDGTKMATCLECRHSEHILWDSGGKIVDRIFVSMPPSFYGDEDKLIDLPPFDLPSPE